MSSDLGRLLHVRSLNCLKKDHPLTYVGGRLLAESLHDDIINEWTVGYLLRRAKTGREPVYWQHSLFKALKPNGEPDFRDCLIGSPTTQLLEMWVIWKLSQEYVFSLSESVFSYAWSSPDSHHTFKYFMEGYRERERAIATAATRLQDPYVVVFDFKGFYPNIDRNAALERFKNRVEKSTIKGNERDIVLQCASGVCQRRKTKGLPIGPPLSHVIANVYLESCDSKLEEAFPQRFFRYVDDIALVVERHEIDKAKRLFRQIVEEEELLINEDKTDVHRAKLWQSHIEGRDAEGMTGSFNKLVTNLTQYLAHNPDEYESLKKRFQDEGFFLPFANVKSVASYSPFRWLEKRLFSLLGWLPILVTD